MAVSDAEELSSADILFDVPESDTFENKCRKIGGQISLFNGISACQIPNNHVQVTFGLNACENKLNGILFRNEGIDICSLDTQAVDDAFTLLQRGTYLNSIGTYTRFTAELQRKFAKEGSRLDAENELVKGLLNSHLFEIDNDIKRLLVLTRTPKTNEALHLPFDTMFLDISFKKEELANLGIDIEIDEIVGILLQKSYTYSSLGVKKTATGEEIESDKTKPLGACINISYYGIKDGKPYFETTANNVNLDDKLACDIPVEPAEKKILGLAPEYRKTQKFIHLFSLNVINFINNPEIELQEQHYDEQRMYRKRIQERKIPIPRRTVIKLTGELKRYVQDLHQGAQWHYGYRFWVRGHFRTFRAERYSDEVRGKRIWVLPFQKGEGLLVEKAYFIDKEEHGKEEE